MIVCHLCLKDSESWCSHHVIFRAYGGTDVEENLIKICNSCHAVLTWGNPIDSYILEYACVGYQLSIYGLDFLIKSSFLDRVTSNIVGEFIIELQRQKLTQPQLDAFVRYIGGLKYLTGVALAALHYNMLVVMPIQVEKMEQTQQLLKLHGFDIFSYRDKWLEVMK